MRTNRGLALVTSIFICMVIFLITTAMVTKVRGDLSLSKGRGEDTKDYYLAQGAVNELLSRINNGEPIADYANYTEFDSSSLSEDDPKPRARVVNDPDNAGIWHIQGEYRGGIFQMSISETSSGVAGVFGGGRENGIWGDTTADPLAATYFKLAGDRWEPVPNPLGNSYHERYAADAGTIQAGDDTCGFTVDYDTDLEGNFYISQGDDYGDAFVILKYDGVGWESLPPQPKVSLYTDGLGYEATTVAGEFAKPIDWVVSRDGRKLYSVHGSGGRAAVELGTIIQTLDLETKTWSTVQPWMKGPSLVTGSHYDPDGNLVTVDPNARFTHGELTMLEAGSDGSVYGVMLGANRSSANLILEMTSPNGLDSGRRDLPPLRSANGRFAQSIKQIRVGPNGEVFAVTRDGGEKLSKFDPATETWSDVALPAGSSLTDSQGRYSKDRLSIDSEGYLVLWDRDEKKSWHQTNDGWSEMPQLPNTDESQDDIFGAVIGGKVASSEDDDRSSTSGSTYSPLATQ